MSPLTSKASADGVAVAYTSLVVPEQPEFITPAVHFNGNVFMREILDSLARGGLDSLTALAALPLRSFPHGRPLLVRRRCATLPSGIQVSYVPYVNLTPLKQLSIGLAMYCNIVRWGRRQRAMPHRLVVAFNLSVPPILFTYLAARRVRAKIAAYICDVNVPGQTVPDTLGQRLDTRLHRPVIPRLDGRIVIADRIAQDFAPGQPYLRVSGGVSNELMALTGRCLAARRHDSSRFTVVATGGLSPFNGFMELLAAWGELPDTRLRLHIAGRGPLEEAVRAATARDARVTYHGFLAYPDLLALHATADVLVSFRLTHSLTTAYAFPSKTMEYFASGVPVITTCTGPVETEFGPYGFLLRDESPGGLARLLRKVMEMEPVELAAYGDRARAFMERQYTWSAQGERIVRYLREYVLDLPPSRDHIPMARHEVPVTQEDIHASGH